MANKILGITIDIEGKTSGLTKSLQEANSAINKTSSALKDVEKALQLDPTNVDLIAQKESLLAKQIEQTNDKLAIMAQVAEDANDALARGDISEEQYAQLTAEIVKTEASLNGLESEANESAEALEDAGGAAEDAGDAAEDSGEKMEQLGEAAKVAGEVAIAAFEAVIASAVAVGAAVVGATAEAGKALANATINTAKFADELLTLSAQTGISAETLQELNYAAELLDVDTSTVTGSMTKLLKTMSSAKDGSSSAQAKFDELGISIVDVNGDLRDSEAVFWDAIDALGQIQNESERDAASMAIFGKSAKELNPLILAGSDAFKQYADEAKSVGYVIDDQTLDAFGALDDNMVRMTNTAEAVTRSFVQILLPLLTDATGDLTALMGDFSGALADAGGDVDKIAGIIETFAPEAVKLVEKYVPQILKIVESTASALLPVLVSLAPQLIAMVSSLLIQLAGSIADNSETFISAFSQLFESVVNSAITILPVLIPLAISMIETLVNSLLNPDNLALLINGAIGLIMSIVDTLTNVDNLNLIINAALSIVMALLEGLTVALPQLIPAVMNAILTIVDTLLSGGALAQIIHAALTLIITLSNALIEYLPVLIGRLPEIIIGIVKFLTGDALPDIINAGVVLITSLVTHLPEIIAAIISALIELVAGMCEYITTDGAEDLAKNFLAVFGMLSDDAVKWGSDLIQGFIDGIKKMASKLTSAVKGVAQTVANFLHFSVPDEGPLADFDKSGGDMIEEFINSMNRETPELEAALNQTAGIISAGMDGANANAVISPFNSIDNGISRIEAAISGAGASGETTIVIPVYLGNDLIDTVVLNSIDKYNYSSGGH